MIQTELELSILSPQPLSVEITGMAHQCFAKHVHLPSRELNHVDLVLVNPLQGNLGTFLETYALETIDLTCPSHSHSRKLRSRQKR